MRCQQNVTGARKRKKQACERMGNASINCQKNVRYNTIKVDFIEIRSATQNFREFARNNMNTYFKS